MNKTELLAAIAELKNENEEFQNKIRCLVFGLEKQKERFVGIRGLFRHMKRNYRFYLEEKK